MTLKQTVQDDLIQAMRDKDSLKKGVLQLLKSGFNNAEREAKVELTDAQLIPIVQREIKQTAQALDGARLAKRDDLIELEETKLDILKVYLPKQLSEEEVSLTLALNGIQSGMKMGDAMKIAKGSFTVGEVDAKTVSTIVKNLIK